MQYLQQQQQQQQLHKATAISAATLRESIGVVMLLQLL
jgi:hypothetical protein